MRGRPQLRVAILYTHPLLGEGIARLLAHERGITVTAASATDGAAMRRALIPAPDVVIFEPGEAVGALDLAARLPDAILIDAGTGAAAGAGTSASRVRTHAVFEMLGGVRAPRDAAPRPG